MKRPPLVIGLDNSNSAVTHLPSMRKLVLALGLYYDVTCYTLNHLGMQRVFIDRELSNGGGGFFGGGDKPPMLKRPGGGRFVYVTDSWAELVRDQDVIDQWNAFADRQPAAIVVIDASIQGNNLREGAGRLGVLRDTAVFDATEAEPMETVSTINAWVEGDRESLDPAQVLFCPPLPPAVPVPAPKVDVDF